MNFNIDPKALVKTAFVSPNDNNRSVRSAVLDFARTRGLCTNLVTVATKARCQFIDVFESAGAQRGGARGRHLEQHREKPHGKFGPTVSAMPRRCVCRKTWLSANGISNPDRIFPGQRLNMSALNASIAEEAARKFSNNPPVANTALAMNCGGASAAAESAQTTAALGAAPGVAKNLGPCSRPKALSC